VLAWAADGALGGVALEHWADVSLALHVMHAHAWNTGGVLATGRTCILALLAHKLGADWAWDGVGLSVLDMDDRTTWVAVVLGLGGVLDALVSLDEVLAACSLEDDATLDIHEIGGLGGGGWHFYLQRNLHQTGEGVLHQNRLANTGAALGTGVGAGLAHGLAAE
jgi:hypothetical protein